MLTERNTLSIKLFTLLLLPSLWACTPDIQEEKDCQYSEWLGPGVAWSSQANPPIPLHSLNWWTYTDSTFREGSLDTVQSKLYYIDGVHQLGDFQAFQFNDFFPMMTVRNDTIFYANWIRDYDVPECYEITIPFLFSTTDSVELENGDLIYFSKDLVHTPAGTFANNIIRSSNDGGIITVFNEAVGIIKQEIILENEDGSFRYRQTSLLKDYSLQE